jgi:transcriptional regulator with XRE-family HTH domain
MRSISSEVLPQSVRAELGRLGELLRAARVARGLSQAEAAKRLRVSIPTIQAIEKGKPGSSLGTFLALMWVVDLGTLSRTVEERLENPRFRRRARRSALDEGLDV